VWVTSRQSNSVAAHQGVAACSLARVDGTRKAMAVTAAAARSGQPTEWKPGSSNEVQPTKYRR
jgi:hypothetical protein